MAEPVVTLASGGRPVVDVTGTGQAGFGACGCGANSGSDSTAVYTARRSISAAGLASHTPPPAPSWVATRPRLK